jgi:predicted P-loop ATPase
MAKVMKLPVPAALSAEEHARAETERRQRLFDWAEAVFKELGLIKALAAVGSLEELRGITFNVDGHAVVLAIRAALFPASGNRAEHFRGLREGGLRRILTSRFAELKKAREAELSRGQRPDWTSQLKLDKNERIIANLANVTLILEEAPTWKGVLAYDQFGAHVVIRKLPPFELSALTVPWTDIAWTDHHETQTRVWFQRQDINPTLGDVGRAVQKAARRNSFHPVRDYLGALHWDGAPRAETWLQTYFRAEDSEYVRAIGPRVLISAVARIFDPGCKVDNSMILEGPQGLLKSMALRALAVRDSWFTDRLSHVGSKDAAIELAGVWIIEIAELNALLRATTSSQKAFLSRQDDRYRPPFAKHTIRQRRSSIFVGTINPPANGYLSDPTGARRLWPVACHGAIDVDGLRQVRDQLWAEAVHLFKAGKLWWLETPKLEALATVEQEARYIANILDEPVRAYVGERTKIKINDVIKHVFGVDDPRRCSSRDYQRVVDVLTHMEFTKRRPRGSDGKRENWYERRKVR